MPDRPVGGHVGERMGEAKDAKAFGFIIRCHLKEAQLDDDGCTLLHSCEKKESCTRTSQVMDMPHGSSDESFLPPCMLNHNRSLVMSF